MAPSAQAEIRVAVAVPNLNQGAFLPAALDSLHQDVPVAVAVLDAGSRDQSQLVISTRQQELAFWRSHPDAGQAAAVNEGVQILCRLHPSVDLVTWLNADDFYLPGGLALMQDALDQHPEWVAVAGGAVVADADGRVTAEMPMWPFDRERFGRMCTLCQPATLIRRNAWEQAGGLDPNLAMCFDYDLWWRLSHQGTIGYIPQRVAASRDHADTKTRTRRPQDFSEATAVVRRELGHVPWHWYISEALERQVGYVVGRRPRLDGRLRAAWDAGFAYWRDRRSRT